MGINFLHLIRSALSGVKSSSLLDRITLQSVHLPDYLRGRMVIFKTNNQNKTLPLADSGMRGPDMSVRKFKIWNETRKAWVRSFSHNRCFKIELWIASGMQIRRAELPTISDDDYYWGWSVAKLKCFHAKLGDSCVTKLDGQQRDEVTQACDIRTKIGPTSHFQVYIDSRYPQAGLGWEWRCSECRKCVNYKSLGLTLHFEV